MNEEMGRDGDHGTFNPVFFGRQREMEWLHDRSRTRQSPIVITGVPGVGKTTLIRQFLASVRTRRPPYIWTARYSSVEAMAEIRARIDELYRNRDIPEFIAIDEAEVFGERELDEITERILNFKAVRALIFATRHAPQISRAEVLHLGPLRPSDAHDMLRSLLGIERLPAQLADMAEAGAGLPLALAMLANLVRGRNLDEMRRLLRGEIYQLDQQIIIPKPELITDVKPRIITVNEALVEQLQRQPEGIYDLPSRKFEKLVAELLTDLGYDVELTPATRDGGKDILAYMTTPHGRLLCLVEAKRYRHDRKVGVELVRELYGTLVDADASSAMLVTTSSFSEDARLFQKRHEYKLSLRDYGNVLQWIQGYGRR
ncbi:restriction endonuclease [Rhizobium esperanzae]|uniref:AAA+ ATPase domain-containing protein n=1 Tax=Rhizobium esperanzae TaxID=1967781 RepID=A0A7W6W7R3_9HYPH|nr:restriction endonuclease [Rhizobium esperanzae]MBB4239084.1 hypothetical protein [Rhizobium esperanzae]